MLQKACNITQCMNVVTQLISKWGPWTKYDALWPKKMLHETVNINWHRDQRDVSREGAWWIRYNFTWKAGKNHSTFETTNLFGNYHLFNFIWEVIPLMNCHLKMYKHQILLLAMGLSYRQYKFDGIIQRVLVVTCENGNIQNQELTVFEQNNPAWEVPTWSCLNASSS